jgi:excisionase family DNA binding protein
MKQNSNKQDGGPLYLTPLEASEILGVDRRTIYNWVRGGKLKALKFGGTWRIPRSSVNPGAHPKQ